MTYCVGPRKPYSVYLAYALFCEGPSDFAYFEVLIPRLIDSIVSDFGVRPVDRPDAPTLRLGQPNRAVEVVAMEACRAKDAFHLAFIHADTGGRRNQEGALDGRSVAYCRKMHEICDFPQPRCRRPHLRARRPPARRVPSHELDRVRRRHRVAVVYCVAT